MIPILAILLIVGLVGGVMVFTPVGSGIVDTLTGNVPVVEIPNNSTGLEESVIDSFDSIGDNIKNNIDLNQDNPFSTSDSQLDKVVDSATNSGKLGAEFFFSAHDLVVNTISAFNPDVDWGIILLIAGIISFIMFIFIIKHVGFHIVLLALIIGSIVLFFMLFMS